MVIGQPTIHTVPTPEQELALRASLRERGVDHVINGRLEAERDCPSCGYPLQGFRATCYVCGHAAGRI